MMGNFFLKFHQPEYPFRFFTSQEQATLWIKEFVDYWAIPFINPYYPTPCHKAAVSVPYQRAPSLKRVVAPRIAKD